MSQPEELTTEIQKLTPSAVIELFELDLSDRGGEVYRFHAGTNELSQNVVWNGNTYTRYPVMASGFEYNGGGQFPRPRLAVSNVLSAISALILIYGDLFGAKVTRRRTLAMFLDAVNFGSGVNATADPEAEFEPDIYFIDRKASETRDVVEFELASAADLMGVKLPRRQVIQNICTWRYRGSECGFTGAPVYNSLDQVIASNSTFSDEAKDMIAKKLALDSAVATLAGSQAALDAATQAKGQACMMERLASEIGITITERAGGPPELTNIVDCVIFSPYYPSGRAYLDGNVIELNSTYRRGAEYYRTDTNLREIETIVYYIETWGIGSGCAAATSAYNAALATRDGAQAALESAEDDYAAALAALPEDDPLYNLDICGKRLNSCKLRFGSDQPLPFGSFPGAGLTK